MSTQMNVVKLRDTEWHTVSPQTGTKQEIDQQYNTAASNFIQIEDEF